MTSRNLAELLRVSRVLVCIGAGGVGKTTLSAALAIAAARQGRRCMVLTIDPAKQLARALGLAHLELEPREVPLEDLSVAGGGEKTEEWDQAAEPPRGRLFAAMLDQKGAWDAFVSRHAQAPEVRRRLLGNRFYQRLSTSFAGSTEFMAIEELLRLKESGSYDLIIIDTPPSGHAVDFFRAPDRIARLFDPEVTKWLSRPGAVLRKTRLPRETFSQETVWRFLSWLSGSETLAQISAFFLALEATFGDLQQRTERAKALLRDGHTAFVLVSGPDERSARQTRELLTEMTLAKVHHAATVINRLAPALPGKARIQEALDLLQDSGLPEAPYSWLHTIWFDGQERYCAQRLHLDRLYRTIHDGLLVEVTELPHDVHALPDLQLLARAMNALDESGGAG